MEEKQRILIGLGAAAAANCWPCFENYFEKARTVNLADDDIWEAVALGDQMKMGAQMAMRTRIAEILTGKVSKAKPDCCDQAERPECCG